MSCKQKIESTIHNPKNLNYHHESSSFFDTQSTASKERHQSGGLHHFESGGNKVSESDAEIEPWQRGIVWLGQQRGLWPHMTLREQAQLLSGTAKSEVLEAMAVDLDLQALIDRHPDQLSGGEAQRGELLRTLCGSAPVLLLDEPFSAQNRQQRERILQVLHKEMARGRTVLIALHEQLEGFDAIHLGDEAEG